MGNHEYNAVAWATPDPQNPEQYLRRRTDKNWNQHKAFLEQVGEGSELHNSMIEWFKTLSVYLDLPELQAVHACWHPKYMNMIDPFTDAGHYWLRGEPAPLTEHIACLDYSVAGGEGGKLCGYRFGGGDALEKRELCFLRLGEPSWELRDTINN